MKQIIRQLKRADHILVTSHINPDGDAVGSLIALSLTLNTLGKRVTLYNESPIPAVYRFLPEAGRIVRQVACPLRYDTAVVLDCGDIGRVGILAPELSRIPVVINIDHHVTNTRFGTLHHIDTGACATAEIICRMIREMGTPITREIATAIYTGILTDTGSFRFANTNPAAFAICHEMVTAGVDPYAVAQHVYGTYSLGRIKLLNLALDSIEIFRNGELSFMTLTHEMLEETGTQPEDIDGMINYAKSIENVRVAVLIHEYRQGGRQLSDGQLQRFHVSLRSDGSVDVAALASDFGGGGHLRAAGFSTDTPLTDLKRGILGWLKRYEQVCCPC